MKYLCNQCKTLATWNYAPGKGDTYCCDTHVPRGCSCNISGVDEDGYPVGVEPVDECGRLYPCCEWNYSEKGFYVFKD